MVVAAWGCVETASAGSASCSWETDLGVPGMERSTPGPAAVLALFLHDDGNGTAVFAGGSFDEAGGDAANNIAKWDGTSWFNLTSGADNSVKALENFNGTLHVGGVFNLAGGGLRDRIAAWTGSGWGSLGPGFDLEVESLAVFNGLLYAGGDFTVTEGGGTQLNHIASWDGASWSPLVSNAIGLNGDALALLAVEAGPLGPALYVGGNFTSAGGLGASNMAMWAVSAASVTPSAPWHYSTMVRARRSTPRVSSPWPMESPPATSPDGTVAVGRASVVV